MTIEEIRAMTYEEYERRKNEVISIKVVSCKECSFKISNIESGRPTDCSSRCMDTTVCVSRKTIEAEEAAWTAAWTAKVATPMTAAAVKAIWAEKTCRRCPYHQKRWNSR
jgi:hypothetical protein